MAGLILPRKHICERFPNQIAFNIAEDSSLFHGRLEDLFAQP